MKLTNKDKEILSAWGYSEDNLEQIERATRKTEYKLNGKEKISCQEANVWFFKIISVGNKKQFDQEWR